MSGTPHDVTRLIGMVAQGDSRAASELLPLVYDELRKLARARLDRERAGQTLQPTALVHEAYLRLVGEKDSGWSGRGHFFGAAALAMRRILVERARSRVAVKRGGDGRAGARRVELDEGGLASEPESDELLALDEVLKKFEKAAPDKAEVVMLRYFAGLTLEETAAALGRTESMVRTDWAYARAWMHREMTRGA